MGGNGYEMEACLEQERCVGRNGCGMGKFSEEDGFLRTGKAAEMSVDKGGFVCKDGNGLGAYLKGTTLVGKTAYGMMTCLKQEGLVGRTGQAV